MPVSVNSADDWHYLDGGLCGCISKSRTAWLIVGGVDPPTARSPGWCPHQPATASP
ncbi:MAG TPA: hypothetical protein VN726_04925 [Hanamia sp.]|nr:hypothetical protein [Hanamia sp.]